MKIYESTNNGYVITTNKNKIDITVVHYYLSTQSYWAKNIPLHVVQRSIENSYCFTLLYKQEQVGFARLITDYATFAYLADVFIIETHRGKGLSKWLLQFIHNNPEVQGLRRWLLGTKDAHELYKQFGWESFGEEQSKRFMQLHNANVYDKK
ncbi:MAG: GNAT family N-acetyltransferase [Bacteroidetes bacterium]|nr:GNAT family N-acetyltransferase [Bacteroidota bacterium]MBS1649402.1 GNAT family N-acetyltransferase [Bacteroidota bacterium]